MGKTVIGIFEDDKINRFIYERLFRHLKSNIDVFIFDNPEKGITMAKLIHFDVVFIEIHFWGDFRGIEILKQLKEVCSGDLIAVGMTSMLQEGDLERIMSGGFNMCLEKPINFQQILPLQSKNFG